MDEPKYINMSARSTVDAKAVFGQTATVKDAADKNTSGNK